jgi:hypothetical protein
MAILKKIRQQKNKTKKTFRNPFSFDEEIQASPDDKKEAHEQAYEQAHEQKKPVYRKKKRKTKGRPKIDKEDRRTKSVSAVLTEKESQKLEKLSKKARLSKSEYIRRLIQQAIEKGIYHL